MGIPTDLLSPVLQSNMPRAQRIATANSLIGNAYHVPSAMLLCFLLLQTLQAASGIPRPIYAYAEQRLRGKVAGTAWQPGAVRSPPGLFLWRRLWRT